MIPKYILYWDKDLYWKPMYTRNQLLLFDIEHKKEIETNTTYLEKIFPFPRNGPFSMWGTPYGHYKLYDVYVITNKNEYYEEIKKYL